jgi:hypothetical protein
VIRADVPPARERHDGDGLVDVANPIDGSALDPDAVLGRWWGRLPPSQLSCRRTRAHVLTVMVLSLMIWSCARSDVDRAPVTSGALWAVRLGRSGGL